MGFAMPDVGAVYLERGKPVRIVVSWRRGTGPVGARNVLIEYADGSRTVRPFRGLRKPKAGEQSSRQKQSRQTKRKITGWI